MERYLTTFFNLLLMPSSNNVETTSDTASYLKNFPTTDVALAVNFSLLPTFVPNDTLEHVKNCGKNTDAAFEFPGSKGLRMLPFVHHLQSRFQECCLYQHFAGLPVGKQ